ncbi:MAG: tyrosine-type recombinase/integrase [Bacteroidota bacterium]
MKDFKTYLSGQQLSKRSRESYLHIALGFQEWLSDQPINTHTVSSYIYYLQQQDYQPATIKSHLIALRHYFKALQLQPNPLAHFYYKIPKIRHRWTVLSEKQLQKLYETELTEKYKVLLSLLIFQGLSTREINSLEVTHIQLPTAQITIPETKKINSRTLILNPLQVPLLEQYISSLTESYLYDQHTLRSKFYTLTRKLKRQHPFFESLYQIRSSVISLWLQNEDVRIVQYKAGHRYVSSTERYQKADLEALQTILSKKHPLS